MKVGIFDPYLDTLGGGERYGLTLAEVLLGEGWQVDVFWPSEEITPAIDRKFNLDIGAVNFVNYSPYHKNLWQRKAFEKNYDLLFYFSDGSIPFMFGRKNWLHFQVPFKNLSPNLLNKIKLRRIDKIVCNSLFTKRVIDRGLRADSTVVYPPVDVTPMKPLKKEKLILAVGRFSQLLQGKRQDVLVEAFKEMVDNYKLKGWRLVLVGGSEVGGEAFVLELKEKSQGYPIEVTENLPFKELVTLYGKARIFWTAAGFDIDEGKEPERVEHFGITTVEAMAAGVVPVVLGKGGQKEIVESGKNGLWWFKKEELITETLNLINNEEKMRGLAENAILRSKTFTKEKFKEEVLSLTQK